MRTTKQTKITNIKFDSILGSSMLLYSKHDGRGGRRRPLSPATNPKNLSRGRFWERQAYEFLKFFG